MDRELNQVYYKLQHTLVFIHHWVQTRLGEQEEEEEETEEPSTPISIPSHFWCPQCHF
jgi:hypothetical protein